MSNIIWFEKQNFKYVIQERIKNKFDTIKYNDSLNNKSKEGYKEGLSYIQKIINSYDGCGGKDFLFYLKNKVRKEYEHNYKSNLLTNREDGFRQALLSILSMIHGFEKLLD